jgi:hypothetical protein
MKPVHERVEPGIFAMRSLLLPAAASALLALGLGMGFSCHSDAGTWGLVAAPAFAAIGAVGGPERQTWARIGIGAISTVINILVMVAISMAVAWTACGY